MDERKNKISSMQLMTFIVSAQMGIGILSLSSRLANIAGHDGWISVLMTGAVCVILSVVLVKLLERYDGLSILDINKLLYGKYIGTFLNILITVNILYKAILNIRMFTEVIKTLILKLTPPTLLTFFIFTPTIYLTWCGLKPICRFASQILVIIAGVLTLFAVVIKFININFLLPVGEAGIFSIAKGMPIIAYSIIAFTILAIIYPEIADKKNVMKHTIGAIVVTTSFYTAVVAVVTGFFGEVMVSHITFPLFSIARAYRAPILERIDFYFLMLWFPAMAMASRAYFFGSYYTINKLLKIKGNTLPLAVLTIAVILLSRIPENLVHLFHLMNISDIVGIPLISIQILGDYLFSFINRKGVKRK